MKRVLVQAFCDLDADNDEEVPAIAEVTFEGRLLDVCELHRGLVEEEIDHLRRLFSAGTEVEESQPRPPSRRRTGRPIGRPPSSLTQTEEWRTCQEPDCVDRRTHEKYIAPTRSALGQHVKQIHGKVLADYDWHT